MPTSAFALAMLRVASHRWITGPSRQNLVSAGIATACTLAWCESQSRPHLRCEALSPPPREAFEKLARDRFKPLVDESATWKAEKTHKGDHYEVVIYTSPSNVAFTKSKRYLTYFKIEPRFARRIPAHAVFNHLFCIEEVLKWNDTIAGSELLVFAEKIVPEERPDVCRYRTNPAAGGIITSREFIDSRLVIPFPPGKLLVNMRWDDHVNLPLTKGTVCGFNVAGCSFMHVYHDSGGFMHIYKFDQSDIGGWLPVSIVNSATGDALLKIAVTMMKAVELT